MGTCDIEYYYEIQHKRRANKNRVFVLNYLRITRRAEAPKKQIIFCIIFIRILLNIRTQACDTWLKSLIYLVF